MAFCVNDISEKTGYSSIFEAMVAFKENQDPNGAWFCIESVRPMVNGLVATYYNQAERLGLEAVVERNDLRQEAYAVLVQALHRFTPPMNAGEHNDECGRAWNRYANMSIKGPIRDAFAKSINTVAVPNWAIKAAHRINKALTNIELEAFNRGDYSFYFSRQAHLNFSAIEIAKRSGIAPSTVKSYLAHGFHLHPTSKKLDLREEELAEAVEEDTNDTTPATTLKADEAKLMNKVFQVLDEPQKVVVAHRFGLDGPVKTQQEVGEMLGMSKKQVRLLEKKALGTMREYLEASDGGG